MNKSQLDILKNLNLIFEKAPVGFCNSDNGKILTHQDIRLRQLSQSIGIPSISNKEMVFRKFNELKKYSYKNQFKKIPGVLEFLSKYGLSKDDVGKILDEIVIEINEYQKHPGRIVFHPFS